LIISSVLKENEKVRKTGKNLISPKKCTFAAVLIEIYENGV